MKYFAMILSLLATVDAFAFGAKIPTESGNYCKDEANEWLEKKFGREGTATSMKKVGSGRATQFWAQTGLCDGAFVLDFDGTEGWQCTQAQYGSRIRFLRQIYAYGNCDRLLPHPEFPHN